MLSSLYIRLYDITMYKLEAKQNCLSDIEVLKKWSGAIDGDYLAQRALNPAIQLSPNKGSDIGHSCVQTNKGSDIGTRVCRQTKAVIQDTCVCRQTKAVIQGTRACRQTKVVIQVTCVCRQTKAVIQGTRACRQTKVVIQGTRACRQTKAVIQGTRVCRQRQYFNEYSVLLTGFSICPPYSKDDCKRASDFVVQYSMFT